MNTEQAPKSSNADADPVRGRGKLLPDCVRANEQAGSAGVVVTACSQKESCGNTGAPPRREPQGDQPQPREGQSGPGGKSERLIVPQKPGNSGGGKGPQCKDSAGRGEGLGIGRKPSNPEIRPGTSGSTGSSRRRSPPSFRLERERVSGNVETPPCHESRMREIRTSGSTGGEWKRELLPQSPAPLLDPTTARFGLSCGSWKERILQWPARAVEQRSNL